MSNLLAGFTVYGYQFTMNSDEKPIANMYYSFRWATG